MDCIFPYSTPWFSTPTAVRNEIRSAFRHYVQDSHFSQCHTVVRNLELVSNCKSVITASPCHGSIRIPSVVPLLLVYSWQQNWYFMIMKLQLTPRQLLKASGSAWNINRIKYSSGRKLDDTVRNNWDTEELYWGHGNKSPLWWEWQRSRLPFPSTISPPPAPILRCQPIQTASP
jgi:hypothetical protein